MCIAEKEIFHRGPISCGIDAEPLEDYTVGIAKEDSFLTNHVISVVGWGTDAVEGGRQPDKLQRSRERRKIRQSYVNDFAIR